MEERMLISDDSDDDEAEGVPAKSDEAEEEVKKPWDAARSYPPDSETESMDDEACYIMILKSLKVCELVIYIRK
jgi:hypothetical protein